MAVKTFAAIDIGSYELSMKIFEVSKKNGTRQIDHIRYSIDMGTESYTTGKLSFERVDELCLKMCIRDSLYCLEQAVSPWSV